MDFTRAELKEQAKRQMEGKIGNLIVCCLVYMLIAAAASALGRITWIISVVLTLLVLPAVGFGWLLICLRVTYGEEPSVNTLFEPFKDNYPKVLVTSLLVGLFTFLWSLLLIVPGVIMGIAYSQSLLILAENPDMEPMDCIRASKDMMMGRKMDYFVLMLSFIPWFLLVAITCGLAALYVGPYASLTEINFYHRIKAGGDGTDLSGTVFEAVENVAAPLDDVLNEASDSMENVADGIVDNISDKFNK
ncbi:MAG: DUF975 family protein [Lachnospiraceae bacterium]|nr:DUF975 family protein [Lachnospiraceae bacterium]